MAKATERTVNQKNIAVELSDPQSTFSKIRRVLGKFGTLLALFLLILFFSLTSEQFLTFDNMINVSRQVSINALLSISLLLTILTAGIDLSVGSNLALSSMVMAYVAVYLGWNPVLALLTAIVAGSLFGAFNGILLTKLHLPHPFISTMGTQFIGRGLALIITGAAPIAGLPPLIQFFGSADIGPVPVSFILVIIVYIIMHIFLTRTTTGRYIYAIGGNKEAARLSGINVDRVLIIVYTLSGLMAALAGIIMAGRVNSAFPLAGLQYESYAIAAVIIGGASFFGGVGTVTGTFIGAMIIAVLQNGLNLLNVSSDLQMAIIGGVIIGAVYVDVLRQRRRKKANN